MKHVLSHKDIVDAHISTSNMLYLSWKTFNISLEDKSILHNVMLDIIDKNNIKLILSDSSTTTGRLSKEVIDYTRNTVCSALSKKGICKIALIIPVNGKALDSMHELQTINRAQIDLRSFLLPSEAEKWLLSDQC